jgi:hypothetical protein
MARSVIAPGSMMPLPIVADHGQPGRDGLRRDRRRDRIRGVVEPVREVEEEGDRDD